MVVVDDFHSFYLEKRLIESGPLEVRLLQRQTKWNSHQRAQYSSQPARDNFVKLESMVCFNQIFEQNNNKQTQNERASIQRIISYTTGNSGALFYRNCF